MSLGETRQPATATEWEELKGLKRADFFLRAAEFAEQKVASGNFDRRFIPPAIPGTISPIDREKVRQNMWRTIALDAIEKGEDLGFTPEELAILKFGLTIAPIIDRIYSRYKKEMVHSELGEKLADMPSKEAFEWLESHGITNSYAIYKEENGETKQVPYALAFQDEYQELDSELEKLLQNLASLPENSQPFIPYFEAYRRALMETDLDKLEERWRLVDIFWMDIKGPFQPIHAMESYVDPTRTRIDPEFRIVIADNKSKNINDQAKLTQQRLIRDLSEVFSGYASFASSKSAIENSLPLAGTTIVMSGINLDFRPAGQNVPNRSDVKAEKGVKIFMDLKTFDIRSKEIRELLTELFGETFAQTFYQDPGFTVIAGVLTAGHEFNHNSFVTPDTDKSLKNRNQVEETKADLGPFITLRKQLEKREISYSEAQKIVAIVIGKGLRIFRIKDKPGQRPYYISSIVEFNLLKEAGVIKKVDSNWTYNFSPETINKFFELAEGALIYLGNAYDTCSQERVDGFLSQYFVESAEILELVNRANPSS